MTKSFTSICLAFFLYTNLAAQTPEELKLNLTIVDSDSARASVLQAICIAYMNVNPDSLIKYTKKLEPYADNPEFEKLKGLLFRFKGAYHMQRSTYDSSIHYFGKSLELAEIAGDTLNIIISYLNIGANYSVNGQTRSSIEILLKTLRFIDGMSSPNPILDFNAYNNLGSAYQGLRNYNEALIYMQKAYEVAIKAKHTYYESLGAENVGSIFLNLSNYDSALLYLNKSLKLYQQQENLYKIAQLQMKIGESLYQNGEDEAGLKHLQKSLKFFHNSDFPNLEGQVRNSLGNLYFKRGNYSKALKAHLIALGKYRKSGALKDEVDLLSEIANDYMRLERMNEAFDFLSQHKVLQDSLFSQQTAEATEEMQAKYETEKKEKELALQTAQISEQRLKLDKQQLVRNIAIGGAILLGLIAFIIYYIKSKSNREISNKNDQLGKSLSERESLLKEIHHRVKNNLQIIASLLYLQSDDTENKSVKKLLEEGQGRVRSMALIHQKLYENDDLKSIPFEEYLQELIGEIQHSFGQSVKNVQLEVNAKDIYFDVDTAVPLGLIINELSTNAFKYAYSKRLGGIFKVELQKDGNTYRMQVADDGVGIPDDQLNNSNSKSLGLKLTKMLSDQLEGEYAFSNSGGTQFELKFAV